MDENKLLNFDLVKDEYGNYYEVVVTKSELGKLKEVTIMNALGRISFFRYFDDEQLQKQYKGKYIGEFLFNSLDSRKKNQTDKGREIYTIQQLIIDDVEVNIEDVKKK